MENIIIDNISLMLLIPFWIFLIIMCGRFFSVYVNDKIIYLLTIIASIYGIFTCAGALTNVQNPIYKICPFIKIENFVLDFGIQVDKISLFLGLILFVISFAVQIYSIFSLKNEKKKYRFFAFLNLFNFGMGALLFSPNLFQMYVFWEIVGVISYLLIGYNYSDPIKSTASKRVFIVNRIGDTALISAILLTSYYMYSYVQNYSLVTLSFEDINVISTLTLAYASKGIFNGICILFMIAAMVKSAQFPFYSWLQDAMEAKIPVSALLHSATLVVLGVYLLLRMMPFFTLNQHLLSIILISGIATAVICSILASIETHPKKILAYSTSANLGLMFTAIGLENIKLALMFLAVHAFIKSKLFLLIPENKKISYYSALLLFLGCLSLAGILFAGVGVKEILYVNLGINKILLYVFLFISFISAYYILRFAFISVKGCEYTKSVGLTELSATILFLVNIAMYVFIKGTYGLSEPVAAAVGGVALAILIYKHNKLEVVSKMPSIVEKVNNKFIPYIYEKFSGCLYKLEKCVFENYKPLICISKSSVRFFDYIERTFMNGAVLLTVNSLKKISIKDKRLQTGNVQNYNSYGFIMITVVITLVIISYMVIIGQIE